MKTIKQRLTRLLSGLWSRHMIALSTALVLAACEAPLNLEQVDAEKKRELRRYDLLQAVAHSGERVAVVSSIGAILVSADNGKSWQRVDVDGRPSLIDVAACPDGKFYALDAERRVWSESGEGRWTPHAIDTPENTLSIHCAPNGRLWVSASFGTLYWSEGSMTEWREFSMNEDLQFTAVRFVDEKNGFAVGEFGTVLASSDGGDSWQPRENIPNEFYPMGVDFLDTQRGWVGGLDGVVWQTKDGGMTWERQVSVTSAPVYNVHASDSGIFAVGGSAKLVELRDGQWHNLEEAPQVLAFMRGIDTLSNGSLLVAGGGGMLASITLTKPSVTKNNTGIDQ